MGILLVVRRALHEQASHTVLGWIGAAGLGSGAGSTNPRLREPSCVLTESLRIQWL